MGPSGPFYFLYGLEYNIYGYTSRNGFILLPVWTRYNGEDQMV